MTPPERYGQARVRRGVRHFLLGKALASILGIAYLVLLVRYVPVPEFAAYSIFQAFVYVFTAVTGLGLLHATLRYVPELYAEHRGAALTGFVVRTFTIRLVALTVATAATYYASAKVGAALNVSDWLPVFHSYLAVVWFRVNAHFLFQILESTLHQGLGQTAFVSVAAAKLFLAVLLISEGHLALQDVVRNELVAEVLGATALLFFVAVVHREMNVDSTDGSFSGWWTLNSRRVISHGISGYLQQLALLPYGSAPNRLVAGRFLTVGSVASFGLAQAVVDVINRYLPAQLLAGLIRPILVAKFVSGRDFSEVTRLLDTVFRMNTALLGLLAGLLIAVGLPLLESLSNGKYGLEATQLMAAMLCVLILESRRSLLELTAQVTEQYGILVRANLGLAMCLVVAIALVPFFDAFAIPIASALALVSTNGWIAHRLARAGYRYPLALRDLLVVLSATGCASVVGLLLAAYVHWAIAAPVVFALSVGLFVLTGVIRKTDIALLGRLRRA